MRCWDYFTIAHRLGPDAGWTWTEPNFEGDMLIEVLEKLGEGGWELVSAVPQSYSSEHIASGETSQIEYIFKRPRT